MLSVARLWCRAEVRRAWPTFVAVTLLAGLTMGFVLTAASASRRVDTGWERLRRATAAPNAMVDVADGTSVEERIDEVRNVPQVVAAAAFTYAQVAPAPMRPGQDAGSFIRLDPETRVYQPLIVEGRRADPSRADEFTVNEAMAREGGYHVGQVVVLRTGSEEPFVELGKARIVGIHKATFDVGINAGGAFSWLTYGFLQRYDEQLELGPGGAMVRLAGGDADLDGFRSALERSHPGNFFVVDARDEARNVQSGLSAQAAAFLVLAVGAALASLAAVFQAIARSLAGARAAAGHVTALGLSGRSRAWLLATPFVLAAVPASVLAVGVGWWGTNVLPSGLARRVDPDAGARFDPIVHVGGGAVVLFVLGCAAVVLSHHGERHRPPAARTSPSLRSLPLRWRLGTSALLARVPSPATIAARSGLVATVLGLAGVTGALVFAQNLDRLGNDPALYGWGFDVAVSTEEEDGLATLRDALAPLADNDDVVALGFGQLVYVMIDGVPVEVEAIQAVRGATWPTVVRGHVPLALDEIVLGHETMASLQLDLGDTVSFGGGRSVRVVGEAVLPEIGNYGDVANGGAMLFDALGGVEHEVGLHVATMTVRPGVDARALSEALIQDAGVEAEIVEAFAPPRVRNLDRIDSTPMLLMAFLSALAFASIAHATVQSARHRRQEFAVLRALGLRPAQVLGSVQRQATVIATVGVIVGVPIGIVAGRWMWRITASGIGVDPSPAVGVGQVGMLAFAAVAAAAATALVPSMRASRGRPALALRSE